MFGSGWGSNTIEKEFIKKLSELEALKKKASSEVTQEFSAADFLISDADDESENMINSNLNKNIKSLSDDLVIENESDDSCKACGTMEHSADCPLNADDMEDLSLDDLADDEDDFESYASKKVQNVLFKLGQVASKLRNSGDDFSADMVEVTALKIKDDETRKVSEASKIINGLRKIASELRVDGDDFSADMVEVTINKIMQD